MGPVLDERELEVEEVQPDGTLRQIGYLAVPREAVPQLGALGVLVGLGVFESLEIVGDGAPPVYQLSPREARLLKIAAKVLG
jgi:hypothetical protein